MQGKYDTYWEKVKDFFSFRLLVGRKIAEILYFIGFVLITVYGLRALIFVLNDSIYFGSLYRTVSRGKLIGLILLHIPLAHLVWRMLFEAFVGIFQTLDAVESVNAELHEIKNRFGD